MLIGSGTGQAALKLIDMPNLTKQFNIKGMHCASCVNVLERSLKKVPGVSVANVNLATEQATVSFDPNRCKEEDLSKAVEKVGYQAEMLATAKSEEAIAKDKQRELKDLKTKVVVSLGLGVLILWGSFPGLMETSPAILKNFWVQLDLALQVPLWAGYSIL